MKIEQVKKLTPFNRLTYFIWERESIRRKKEAGEPAPWTDDEVLRSTYFTNIQRELDKVTTWFREKIRNPFRDNPNLLFATIAFRWFNWPITGSILLQNGWLTHKWSASKAVQRLVQEREKGCKLFSGAYNISNGGSTKSKINRVCEDYIQPAWERSSSLVSEFQKKGVTLRSVHEALGTLPGMGGSGFMAAQVVADMKYTSLLSEEKVEDWWTWCSPGPGSLRGINILLGRPLETAPGKGFLVEVNRLQGRINELKLVPKLHAQDVQNCLCEYSKYSRALEGGHNKRKYNGI